VGEYRSGSLSARLFPANTTQIKKPQIGFEYES
jgi:hypothetical protein